MLVDVRDRYGEEVTADPVEDRRAVFRSAEIVRARARARAELARGAAAFASRWRDPWAFENMIEAERRRTRDGASAAGR